MVRRRLGSGPSAQGDAYEVLDTFEGDVVALKLLTALPAGGPWAEAQILRRLVDPHILPIRNADFASGQPYLVTELAPGGTIDQHIANAGSCGLGVDDTVQWIRQACHGVARAHDLGLLHNDIKPGNLFLDANGDAMVGDFGFASLLPIGSTAMVPPGATIMTAAPEIAQHWGSPVRCASVRRDVYSLASTAFWMLTGRTAHDFSAAPNFPDRVAIVANQDPPRLRDLAPHVPQSVAITIERAMSRNPADRFASANELAAVLGRRPQTNRNWIRSDDHPAHLSCWRGDPAGGGSVYMLCLDAGTGPTMHTITATQRSSGHRINRGCRTTTARAWAKDVRGAIRDLG
jgi:serine/threonine-protein kinase